MTLPQPRDLRFDDRGERSEHATRETPKLPSARLAVVNTCLSDLVPQSSFSIHVETRETLGHPLLTYFMLMVYLLISASQRFIVETANPVCRPRHW